MARAIGLPADEHAKILDALLANFGDLDNSSDSALRIYLKTKRYKVVKDALSALSVKRCREEGSGSGSGAGTGVGVDDEPKRKVSKTSANRRVPLSEVRETMDKMVDRFGVVIAGLCDEIRRLQEKLDDNDTNDDCDDDNNTENDPNCDDGDCGEVDA
jgi:uncharacterized spore protein YtfJ